MATTEHSTVIGVFRDHTRATQAIDELHHAGFRDDKIRVRQEATASGLLDPLASQLTEYEAEGRTLPDELMDKGIPQDEAYYYQQEFEAGHSVVTVESNDHAQEVRAILQRYGAYDASRAGTSHSPYEQTKSHRAIGQMEGDRTIPVREEVLQAHKQLVQTGEVVLRKEVVTEDKTITVPITREELVIERRPTSLQPSDQPVQAGETLEEALKDGGTLRIVLHEERVRIEKYPVVLEEILISKRQIEEQKPISGTVKREVVYIERNSQRPTTNQGNEKI